MTPSVMVLGLVLATLLRTQTLVEAARTRVVFAGLGSVVLLLLPLLAIWVVPDFGADWRNFAYQGSFALISVLLVWRIPNWEQLWSVPLLWALLPFIYTYDNLGMWLSLITAEFLLLFAYQTVDQRTEYQKYALLRLMVIFQFFVFEHLFVQARPAWAGEILGGLLLVLYGLSMFRMFPRPLPRGINQWIFFLSFLQYGIMMFDKIILDTFARVSTP